MHAQGRGEEVCVFPVGGSWLGEGDLLAGVQQAEVSIRRGLRIERCLQIVMPVRTYRGKGGGGMYIN